VTIFLPFTNFVDVDDDRKLPPIAGWLPALKDELEKDENLWQQTEAALVYKSSLHYLLLPSNNVHHAYKKVNANVEHCHKLC